MEIVIVGAGAMGVLFGSYLSRGGHRLMFVEKNEAIVAAINEHGIGFMDKNGEDQGDLVYVPAMATSDPATLKECGVVILAVKSFDTRSAVASISHLVTKNSPLITIQTGLGNLEAIAKIERRKNTIAGFTYMAGAALGPGQVRLGGIGKTVLGELDGKFSTRVRRLSALFNESGLETELELQIIARLWCKVLVYSAINPITGLLRVKNGQLLEGMESIDLAKRLIDEGCLVARAWGIDLTEFDLYELFFDTCRQTAGNISSMLQDLLSGRKTEVDALNGEIARLGREKYLPGNTHLTVMELVKLAEKWAAVH